jgi:hypothetical protein
MIGSLPDITYTDRVLEGLPEVDEADKNSIAKGDGIFTEGRKVVSPDSPLKPVRQFYRE